MTRLVHLEELERYWKEALCFGHPCEWVRNVSQPKFCVHEFSFEWHSTNILASRRGRSRSELPSCPHAALLSACAQHCGLRLSSLEGVHFCGVANPVPRLAKEGVPRVRFTACEVLLHRLEGQVGWHSLEWTEADAEAFRGVGDYEAFMEVDKKCRLIGNGQDQIERCRHYYWGLEDSYYRLGLIDGGQDWNDERLKGLVKYHLDSLKENIFDSSGGLTCPNAPCISGRDAFGNVLT